ncbi:MAG: RNA 2',3'-cyclic phosphodiesterase [Rhodospirillaceae bacterium]
MIRLFVALGLPDDIRDRLAGLAGGVPGARWVEPSNLHLTLRFIGETGGDRLADLDAELAAVTAPAFELVLDGLGQFGSGRKLHTLWAGVERSESLRQLQARVESAVVRAGFAAEGRKFSPHVSLARLKDSAPERVMRYLSGNGLFRSRPFRVDSISLYESHLGRHGPDYAVISTYPLHPPRDPPSCPSPP